MREYLTAVDVLHVVGNVDCYCSTSVIIIITVHIVCVCVHVLICYAQNIFIILLTVVLHICQMMQCSFTHSLTPLSLSLSHALTLSWCCKCSIPKHMAGGRVVFAYNMAKDYVISRGWYGLEEGRWLV